MGSWHPVANLRDYVSQHPPGVTFFLCLLILAGSLICLGSYGHTHILPNPDNTQDWNHLLASLSSLQLCETTSVITDELVSSPPPIGQKTDGTLLTNSSPSLSPVMRLSLQVPLALSPASQSLNGLELHTTLLAKDLDLTGDGTVNVTLQFFSRPTGEDTWTCLTISAPSHILPLFPLPPQCPTNEMTDSPVQVVARKTDSQMSTASEACYSLESTFDPALTLMLTQEQQGVAGRHLQEVSVFLLGVCVLLCLSSTVSHLRRHQGNELDLHRQALIDP